MVRLGPDDVTSDSDRKSLVLTAKGWRWNWTGWRRGGGGIDMKTERQSHMDRKREGVGGGGGREREREHAPSHSSMPFSPPCYCCGFVGETEMIDQMRQKWLFCIVSLFLLVCCCCLACFCYCFFLFVPWFAFTLCCWSLVGWLIDSLAGCFLLCF